MTILFLVAKVLGLFAVLILFLGATIAFVIVTDRLSKKVWIWIKPRRGPRR